MPVDPTEDLVARATEIMRRYFPSPADEKPRRLAAAAIVGEVLRSTR